MKMVTLPSGRMINMNNPGINRVIPAGNGKYWVMCGPAEDMTETWTETDVDAFQSALIKWPMWYHVALMGHTTFYAMIDPADLNLPIIQGEKWNDLREWVSDTRPTEPMFVHVYIGQAAIFKIEACPPPQSWIDAQKSPEERQEALDLELSLAKSDHLEDDEFPF